MSDCPDCHQHTRGRGRCPDCRAEHAAQGVDHRVDDAKTCAWCGHASSEGHYARTGRWLCDGCVRKRLATLTDAADPDLAAAVQWAVGGADPEVDPGADAFTTVSTRLVADGGDDNHDWALDRTKEYVHESATAPQDDTLWTSKARLKAEASKTDHVERDEIAGLVDGLEARGDIVYWHGLIAPATEEHIAEIVESEVEAEHPRKILIGRLNRAKSPNQAPTDGGEA